MEGPTPVSALIHAATMVTAGVFLICRAHPFFDASDHAGDLAAWIGAITALLAASVGLAQNDIKRVLAYSTISQLGYMFLAVGIGAYSAAMFHMITHAFFKALLFLGAGSVIHGMHDEQDMRRMGALRKWMPDHRRHVHRRLARDRRHRPVVGLLVEGRDPRFGVGEPQLRALGGGVVAAVITAFYMTRQVYLVFYGNERWREPREDSSPRPLPTGRCSRTRRHPKRRCTKPKNPSPDPTTITSRNPTNRRG